MKRFRNIILIFIFLTVILICIYVLQLHRLDELLAVNNAAAVDLIDVEIRTKILNIDHNSNREESCSRLFANWTLTHKTQLKLSYEKQAVRDISLWKTAESWTSQRNVFIENATIIGALLHDMSQRRIVKADVGYRGTQLKLLLHLEGDQKVSFKPKWYARDYVVTGAPYSGADRHNGEIAAFHLIRILGFQRTPLTVGRKVDLEKEILPVATDTLKKTFFQRDGNVCFYGKCYYCRGEKDGVCAEGSVLEGAVTLWMAEKWKLVTSKHPWRRSYNARLMPWEEDDKFCDTVVVMEPFNSGPRLLDIIDTTVLDYLTGNADRHRYETFDGFADSILLMMDNAKSFGNPHHDERSILAPLYQCCRIRQRLWQRLQELRHGLLSSLLRCSLRQDPLHPVLHELHFKALDRRLEYVIDTVRQCIEQTSSQHVLINDGYS